MPYVLNQSDVALLKEIIAQYRDFRNNIPCRPTQERSYVEGADHQAPEVYVGWPADEAGIPACTGSPGSGTDYAVPGCAKVNLYKIAEEAVEGTELCNATLQPLVDGNGDPIQVLAYNLSDEILDQYWVLLTRDKFGRWLAICI